MSKVIRIEDKIHYYNETPSLQLDFVDNIKWSYDKGHIYKSINIGYQDWSAEVESGLDDPQTKKTYATILKQIGQSSTLLSKFFAAALAIEEARRKRIEATKDYRLDEKIMIIALSETISPSYFAPELSENFSQIENLNNFESRYNLRLTPAWNFLRWIYFFRGCLQSYTDSDFKFTQGEGNYNFAGVMDDDSDCILFTEPLVAENMDIPMDIGDAPNYFLHLPDQWEFTCKLSFQEYKTIRNNRKNAILVSPTDVNHKICFIDTLDYNPNKSTGEFKVWLGGRENRFENADSPFSDDFGDFRLNAKYGMVIESVIGTGVPAFSYPIDTNESLSFSVNIEAQTFQVDLSGFMLAPNLHISLYVDGFVVDCSSILDSGIQSHFLTLPNAVSPPSDIRIIVELGTCGQMADSDLFGVSNSDEGDACSDLALSPVTLYWLPGAFGPGITLYLDQTLSAPLTGYDFVAYDGDTTVYNIDSSTGIVGTSTGIIC